MINEIVYNAIGKNYDNTRRPDPCIVEQLTNLLELKPNGKYIDIGCGSGNYTGALAQRGFNIEGIDIAEEMLKTAREKHPFIKFISGSALDPPYENETFDGATCVLATHHIKNLRLAFEEGNRTLKKGNFVIFTSTPQQMQYYWLNYYFPKMMQNSIANMASYADIKTLLEQAGFNAVKSVPFFVTVQLQDMFLQSGKYRPEIYLDSNIRNGISSFRLSVEQQEFENGLAKLTADIETGKIKTIINEYENGVGDYLFVVGSKQIA